MYVLFELWFVFVHFYPVIESNLIDIKLQDDDDDDQCKNEQQQDYGKCQNDSGNDDDLDDDEKPIKESKSITGKTIDRDHGSRTSHRSKGKTSS